MERRRRVLFGIVLALVIAALALWGDYQERHTISQQTPPPTGSSQLAATELQQLPIKGRAPKTGYSREQFGPGWAETNGCDTRERILARDLRDITYRANSTCIVESGTLDDPYTGKTIHFNRGPNSSEAVQIDHVIAIGDAWQKGAQQLSLSTREQLYNDPLELLAVDGPTNQQKSDGDAATWLPPNKPYRCRYVARQIAVKIKYHLWVTQAEHDAMQRVLNTCPTQVLPITE